MSSKSASFQALENGSIVKCKLGTYKITSYLARGRVCSTHVGKNEPIKISSPLYVAIKYFSQHQEYRGALQRELMVLEAMSGNTHIVQQLCEMPSSNCGNDMLILELLTGTMDSVLPSPISDHYCPSPWLLRTFALHTVRGLKSLHENGFVHGDIKLQNVMWCSERSVFVLIDFGLSTRVNERYSFQIHSKGCSAPEVVKWNALVSARSSREQLKKEALERPGQPSDIWALGCTLAKAVLGVSLFCNGGPEQQTTVDGALEAQFTKIASRYSPEFFEDLLGFIRLCLRVAPAERATATELCKVQWRGADKPSHMDMATLPCPILKIQNVCDPGTASVDMKPLIYEIEKNYGKITKHRLVPQEGSLYILFKECLDAELGCEMMQRKKWRGRHLLPMFYPVELYLDDD